MLIRRFDHITYRALVAGMLCVSLVLPASVIAAENNVNEAREEITLSPTTKKHNVEPGETLTDSFKVVNSGAVEFDFAVYGRPYSVENETYKPDFSSPLERSDAYSWVQFDQTEWTLEPGQTVEVRYTMRVPSDATPGGHYGILFAETQPSEENDDEAVVRKKRVGTILRVNVAGDITQSGIYRGTTISPVQFRPPLVTQTRLANTGNVDYEAELRLTVKDLFGNVKYSEEKSNVVFPDTTRAIEFNWEEVSWFGIYSTEVSTEFLDESKSQSQIVLIVPRWLLVVLVLGLIGGGYVFFRRGR